MTGPLRLAAADDPLALARAEAIAADLLVAPGNGRQAEVVRVDAQDARESGAVVAAVRQAVLEGTADVAVLPFEGLPLDPAPGLALAAVPMRADARDVLIAREGKALQYLPEATRIGVGSARVAAQLLRRRGDVVAVPQPPDLLGQLAALDRGEVDAVVVAAEALDRLDLLDRATQYFDSDLMIPAPGQAALALEVRDDDPLARARVAPLDDEPTAYAVRAERACLRRLGVGPERPLGIFALTDGALMAVHGIVSRPDGSKSARLRWSGPWRAAEEVGETLAELLLAAGAGRHLGLPGDGLEALP